MTLANVSLKGGHPTGVTLFDTGLLINTVASPASSIRIRTSFRLLATQQPRRKENWSVLGSPIPPGQSKGTFVLQRHWHCSDYPILLRSPRGPRHKRERSSLGTLG